MSRSLLRATQFAPPQSTIYTDSQPQPSDRQLGQVKQSVFGGQGAPLLLLMLARSTKKPFGTEDRASVHAASHRRGKEEERPHRCGKIYDCLRCDFLPECYMAPTAIREGRRTLRYPNLLVRQMVQLRPGF